MEVPIDRHKRFVAVEFPGIVENVDKAMECLGGLDTVNKVYADKSKRMVCSFRPECPFVKSVCGDRGTCSKLLLRVRRRRKIKTPPASSEQPTSGASETGDEYEYEARVLGIIDEVYKFDSLMDHQYLPAVAQPGGTYKSIRSSITVHKLEDSSWLKKEAPLFLPPQIFSRIDRPVEYSYRDMPHRRATSDPSVHRDPRLIGGSRQRRPHFTRFAAFDDATPETPMKEAILKFKAKLTDVSEVQKMRQLFEERPVWSKNALKANANMSLDQYKIVLPTIAYFFTTGPWRSMWTRLGYDPRKDPSAKKYQLVDFRVRQKAHGDKLGITTKRTTYEYSLPTNVVKAGLSRPAIIAHETFNVDWTQKDDAVAASQELDATYKFRPGILPAFRQMFYQLVDVEEPRVQAILHENDGQEIECTEKDGWCTENYQERCREIIAEYVNEFVDRQPLYSIPSKQKGKKKTKAGPGATGTSPSATAEAEAEGLEEGTGAGSSDEDDFDSQGENEDDDEEEELDVNEMEIEMLDLMAPGDDDEDDDDGETDS